jgi:hypothetical protein
MGTSVTHLRTLIRRNPLIQKWLLGLDSNEQPSG